MDNFPIKYTLSQATLRDAGALRDMDKVCFPQDAWPLIEIIAALTFPGLLRIKAVHAEKVIGFVGGDIRRSQGVGWVTTLSVLPEFRRHGVANALMEACETEMGMEVVRLSVRKSNFTAQRLYFNRGYKQVDTWENYYDGGEDALVLEKHLLANS